MALTDTLRSALRGPRAGAASVARGDVSRASSVPRETEVAAASDPREAGRIVGAAAARQVDSATSGLAYGYPGVSGGSTAPANPPRGFARGGGRVSWDDAVQFMGGFQYIMPPDDFTGSWRVINLDQATISGMSPTRLLQVLADLAPDVSRALWDFLRLCNPGWQCQAFRPGTEQPHPQGQKVLDAWTDSLRQQYGSVDVPIARLHFGSFLRGGLFAELVFDEQARAAIDLATPDPATVRFRRRLDPVRGQVWDLGQFQMNRWVLLDRPTVRYMPIDPAPGSPYGRSPAAPALFTSLFLLGLLHDLRRVVAAQGYPRYDIVILLEQLKEMALPQVKADPNAWREFVDATTNEVASVYGQLEPDSAFVHTDLVQVNPPTGAVKADMLSGVGQLIQSLERLLARALKSMPLLMGMLEGSSEANANRQWELQAAGVKAVQHLSESLLSEFGSLVLSAAGVEATCRWKFAELRAAELYRDAMTKALLTDNATKSYLMGWDSQETASLEATGHLPDADEPRFLPSNQTPFAQATASGQPQQGGRGGAQKLPKSDNAGNSPAGEENNAERSSLRRRRDFLRLRWDVPDELDVREVAPPIKPLGQALPTLPERVKYDQGEQVQLARLFDRAAPRYAGLLDARVEPSTLSERWARDDQPVRAPHTNGRTNGHALEPVAIEGVLEAREAPGPVQVIVVAGNDGVDELRRELHEMAARRRIVSKTLKHDRNGRVTGSIEVHEVSSDELVAAE